MSTYTFASAQIGRFSVAVEYDEGGYSMNPREDGDWNLVEFALTHRRYDLPNEIGLNFDYLDTIEDVEAEIRAQVGNDLAWIGKVAGYDHGGLRLSFADSHDRWDGGFAGFGIIRRSTLARVGHDWKRITARRRAELAQWAATELERYNAWAAGEVYYWTVLDQDGSAVESCHGYIGDEEASYAMTEAVAEAEHLEAQAQEADEIERELAAVERRVTEVVPRKVLPVLDNLPVMV